jgi:hypothetical protein
LEGGKKRHRSNLSRHNKYARQRRRHVHVVNVSNISELKLVPSDLLRPV